MGFLDKLKNTVKSHPDRYAEKSDVADRFEPVNESELADSGMAMLSFYRERCFRGNARRFKILIDGRQDGTIDMEARRDISVEPGFHSLHIKLDSLTSPVMNVKAEAGERYCFNIACTMEDGMVLKRVDAPRDSMEEA